jgi:hypothetical protein
LGNEKREDLEGEGPYYTRIMYWGVKAVHHCVLVHLGNNDEVKIVASQHVKPCSLVDSYQSFGGTSCLYRQGRRIFYDEDEYRTFLSTRQHCVTSQNVTAGITSNFTQQ